MEKGEFDDCILIFFNLVESLDVGSGNYVGEVNFNGRPHGYGDIKGVNLLNPPEMRNIHITGISMNEKSGLCKSLFYTSPYCSARNEYGNHVEIRYFKDMSKKCDKGTLYVG